MTPDELIRVVGENVRKYRLRAGITQAEAARRAEMEPGRLSNIEKGKRACELGTLARIAAVLAVQPWQLLKPSRAASPEVSS